MQSNAAKGQTQHFVENGRIYNPREQGFDVSGHHHPYQDNNCVMPKLSRTR